MKTFSEILGPILYQTFRPLKKLPFMEKILRTGYYELMGFVRFTEHRLRTLGKRENLDFSAYRQAPLSWPVAFGGAQNPDELCALLDHRGVRYEQGGHTIYLPPQDNLAAVLGDLAEAYPPDAGYKILKNFAAPEQASYLNSAVKRARGAEKIAGDLRTQEAAAAALFALGLGPKLYDLIELQSGEQRYSCFVVQHVAGTDPSMAEYDIFMRTLQQHIRQKHFSLTSIAGLKDDDFLAKPNCNGNLIRDAYEGKLLYIDFQQFLPDTNRILAGVVEQARQDLHFGDTYLHHGKKKSLYQAIPGAGHSGKRDTGMRWPTIREMLSAANRPLHDRVVLDICCNAGLMSALALNAGASWVLGWDLPNVIVHSQRILALLGANRTQLFPAQLGPEYKLTQDIPQWITPHLENSVVFYLAAWHHVGLIRDLANIPWQTLVFESHQNETVQDLQEVFADLMRLWQAELHAVREIADESGKRTLAIFLRKTT